MSDYVLPAEENSMKLRWLVLGLVAVAAGSLVVIKHFVDNRKPVLDVVDTTDDKNFNKFSHEILDNEFDDTEFYLG